MSPHVIAIGIAVGSAALAVWTDFRFPRLHPKRVLVLFLHMLGATVGANVLIAALQGPVSVLGALASIFLLQVPSLVYLFLVMLWTLRTARDIGFAGAR